MDQIYIVWGLVIIALALVIIAAKKINNVWA